MLGDCREGLLGKVHELMDTQSFKLWGQICKQSLFQFFRLFEGSCVFLCGWNEGQSVCSYVHPRIPPVLFSFFLLLWNIVSCFMLIEGWSFMLQSLSMVNDVGLSWPYFSCAWSVGEGQTTLCLASGSSVFVTALKPSPGIITVVDSFLWCMCLSDSDETVK